MAAAPVPKYPVFRTSIEKLFGNWQALQVNERMICMLIMSLCHHIICGYTN